MISSPEISVLVPIMNEQGNIAPLIDEIMAVYKTRAFEIIYIDDGSTDASANELEAIAAQTACLRVIRHEICAGQSAALYTGLLHARAPLIAILDGDGQNIPADLPALETALLSVRPRLGMVGGVRIHRQDSWLKRKASLMARYLRRALLHDDHPDSGCGLKLIDKEIFLRLPYFNHMHRFMPSLVRRHGGVVLAVNVKHRARSIGASKYGILDRLIVGVSDILGVIWLIRRTAPHGTITEITLRGKSSC